MILYSLFISAVLIACATPTTHRPTVTLPELAGEITHQVRDEFREQMQIAERIERVAFPLLKACVTSCDKKKKVSRFGFTYMDGGSLADMDNEIIRSLSKDYYNLSDLGPFSYIVGVIPGSGADKAGMKVGDRVVRFGDREVAPVLKPFKTNYRNSHTGRVMRTEITQKWYKTLGYALNDSSALKDTVQVQVLRSVPDDDSVLDATRLSIPASKDTLLELSLVRQEYCAIPIYSVTTSEINAYTDGQSISLTSSMLKFASDEELALVIAHELAHCVEGHIEKKEANAMWGAIGGAFLDGFMGGMFGVSTYGQYSRMGEKAGALSFSQAFELEADYAAMYILARAGYDTENAASFWRRMAEKSSLESNSLNGTHPPTAGRYLMMAKTHVEIEKKKAAGLPLLPNRKESAK